MSSTYTSKFPEVLTASVMRNLKNTNAHAKKLTEQITKTIVMLQRFYIANPTEASAEMLLNANEINGFTKCVAKRTFDDNSVAYIQRTICSKNFTVQITSKGVRYVPKPHVIAEVKDQFAEYTDVPIEFYE